MPAKSRLPKPSVSISGKASLPKAPFAEIAATILGKKYELSIVAATPKMARDFNKKYRGSTYVPDVLAFPLSKSEGEVVLNAEAMKREAKKNGMKPVDFVSYIFMHACIHLTGLEHGKKMSAAEAKFAKKLGIKSPSPIGH